METENPGLLPYTALCHFGYLIERKPDGWGGRWESNLAPNVKQRTWLGTVSNDSPWKSLVIKQLIFDDLRECYGYGEPWTRW